MITGSNDVDESFGFPTEKIISSFERKIKQNIFTKTLLATQDGQPLKFTDEEMAYMTKQAVEESPLAEMKIEVPAPTITLKKGKTELNIKNAATLLQKIEQKYPSKQNSLFPDPHGFPPKENDWTNPYEPGGSISNTDVVTAEEIDEIIDELDNKEIEEPGSSTRVHISSKPAEEGSMVDKFKQRVNFPHKSISDEVANRVASEMELPNKQPSEVVKTVNRNAYEIREGVLAMALDFVKWQTDTNMVLAKESGMRLDMNSAPKSDIILEVAKKFYTFVEDRRR
jgi:hypothetical protein